jgi:hypothetical protein
VHRVAAAVSCFFQEPVVAELLSGDGQGAEEVVHPSAGDGLAVCAVLLETSRYGLVVAGQRWRR